MSGCVRNEAETSVSRSLFALFCFGAYLLAIAYGTTFLLASLVISRGGDEGDAGSIISVAIVSTILSVLFSGHVSDAVGSTLAAGFAGLVLAISCLGFALVPGVGAGMMFFSLLLGCGWGVFYTLGPMIVATIIPPRSRIRYFALLSGSMMTGIGTGPILGRVVEWRGGPLESAYLIASIACIFGGVIIFYIHKPLQRILALNGTTSVSRLTLGSAKRVLRAKAVFPIVMVGLGGAIFGGISSFQTSYAEGRGLDYSLFFLGFMSAAIGCRMFLSGMVTRQNPYLMGAILTFVIVISIAMFQFLVTDALSYLLAAATLGVGYGLTYSVINGLAANEAPPNEIPQSLLLFSLSYFLGVFGFPLIAGQIIVGYGVSSLLMTTMGVAVLNFAIALMRLLMPSQQENLLV